jgi:hypothetical protein
VKTGWEEITGEESKEEVGRETVVATGKEVCGAHNRLYIYIYKEYMVGSAYYLIYPEHT